MFESKYFTSEFEIIVEVTTDTDESSSKIHQYCTELFSQYSHGVTEPSLRAQHNLNPPTFSGLIQILRATASWILNTFQILNDLFLRSKPQL